MDTTTRYAWEDYVRTSTGGPVRFLGTRFNAEGKFLPECGNTVVRHVIPGSKTQEALEVLRAALMELPYSHHFAYTETSSYHMTVFEGIIDSRRTAHFWPEVLPIDISVGEATRFLDERLSGFVGPGDFVMRPLAVTPFGLRLEGATKIDTQTARVWRNALIGPFDYRSPQHNGYQFHTTIAYIKDWLPDDALPVYRDAMEALTADFVAAVPVMELGPPAFCTFNDMNAFPSVRILL